MKTPGVLDRTMIIIRLFSLHSEMTEKLKKKLQ